MPALVLDALWNEVRLMFAADAATRTVLETHVR
jgi:hypothetical protein